MKKNAIDDSMFEKLNKHKYTHHLHFLKLWCDNLEAQGFIGAANA